MTSSYGTATAPPAAGNGNGNGVLPGDEEEPLLGGRHGRKPVSKSLLVRWRKQLRAEVSRSWADLVLLLCYVVTGLLDSSSTQVWGAFVSMQTGTFLALPMIPIHWQCNATSYARAVAVESCFRRRVW